MMSVREQIRESSFFARLSSLTGYQSKLYEVQEADNKNDQTKGKEDKNHKNPNKGENKGVKIGQQTEENTDQGTAVEFKNKVKKEAAKSSDVKFSGTFNKVLQQRALIDSKYKITKKKNKSAKSVKVANYFTENKAIFENIIKLTERITKLNERLAGIEREINEVKHNPCKKSTVEQERINNLKAAFVNLKIEGNLFTTDISKSKEVASPILKREKIRKVKRCTYIKKK